MENNLMALEALFMSLMAIISVCIGIGAFAVLRGLFSVQKLSSRTVQMHLPQWVLGGRTVRTASPMAA